MKIRDIYSDIKKHYLEYITMLVAMLGAALASSFDDTVRGWGFLLWIFSNGWMLFGFIKYKNIPYSILFLYYEITNIAGIYNNWIR